MSKLANLKFDALKVSGDNYMSWVIDAGLYLKSQGLYYTIDDSQANEHDRSTTMVIIHHHLHEDLKAQYLTVTEPEDLWWELKDCYDHQQNVTLPIARYKWLNLRFQDHKSVFDYNSDLFRITTILKLCGEEVSENEMLEKTFTTFHASNIILQQQYRERRFSKYSELILCLLVAEKNNELLIKNHETHPTGSKVFPEVNANTVRYHGRGRNRGRGRGRGHGHGNNHNPDHRRGYGRNTDRGHGNGRNPGRGYRRTSRRGHGYFGPSEYKGKDIQNRQNAKEGVCYRCGCYNHWSNECSTHKHLVELYQASIKEKGKKPETHFIEDSYPKDVTHLNVTDFFDNPKDKPTASIGDGNVHTN